MGNFFARHQGRQCEMESIAAARQIYLLNVNYVIQHELWALESLDVNVRLPQFGTGSRVSTTPVISPIDAYVVEYVRCI